jgi:hypothetical protein
MSQFLLVVAVLSQSTGQIELFNYLEASNEACGAHGKTMLANRLNTTSYACYDVSPDTVAAAIAKTRQTTGSK